MQSVGSRWNVAYPILTQFPGEGIAIAAFNGNSRARKIFSGHRILYSAGNAPRGGRLGVRCRPPFKERTQCKESTSSPSLPSC